MTVEAPPQQQTDTLEDRLGRSLRSLRVSVIDRCNLRCNYCMPEEQYVWLPHQDILSFAEIGRLVDVFSRLGVNKVRLTGGEPLLRARLPELVELLAQNPRLQDLALTTNGTELARWAVPLREAGLQRVTVSLDSLQRERFASLTRRDAVDQALEGIRAAAQAGFQELKINTVVMRGFNEDEIEPMVEFARQVEAEVRFIEYMDVGGATHWSADQVFSRAEIMARLASSHGSIRPAGEQGAAPAERFLLPDGTAVGIVASVTEPFCSSCDRSRITADGVWYLCLYARDGVDLRHILRHGGSDDDLTAAIRLGWEQRDHRAAEERAENPARGALYQVEELKADPHREMHTRGG